MHYFKNQSHFVMLDSNGHVSKYSTHDCLLAIGCVQEIKIGVGEAFTSLKTFIDQCKDWVFGYLTYDLKNEIENLTSQHDNHLQVAAMHFFVPELVIEITHDQLVVHSKTYNKRELKDVLKQVFATDILYDHTVQEKYGKCRVNKKEYIENAQHFLNHIQRGDIYEANYCIEFYAHDCQLDSLRAYHELNAISEPSFASYARFNEIHIMCASPERYLKKIGDRLISQPIKGTARRSPHIIEDEQLKKDLFHDPKERSENIMIVDLVRNDLSKTAQKGSVTVEELCKVYSFKQVHQMISTISSQVVNTHPVDLITTTFPMGSMTGAPKISAMSIIDELENSSRGIYSGSIGYFKPNGDFDFNVIIRTILYNSSTKYLSYSVGSAITAAAQPDKEYDECLLKARALKKILKHQGIIFT